MLVSILLATRSRVNRAIKTIKSICNTANSEDFEILLRIDDDDHESIASIPLFKRYEKVSKIIVGNRYRGYLDHSKFMDELVEVARGKWLFFFDDDTIIMGKGWDEKLTEVPLHGKIVHPEFYWLGPSKYPSGSCEPVAICVPNRCWEQYGQKILEQPIDMHLQQLLSNNGWENYWLRNIVAYHKRDDEATLFAHRQL